MYHLVNSEILIICLRHQFKSSIDIAQGTGWIGTAPRYRIGVPPLGAKALS